MTSERPSDAVGRDLSFEEMVAALRRGDVECWTRIYRALVPLASAHLRRKFGSEVAREENAGGEAAHSAYRTFLRNLKAGNWEIHDWDHLAGQFLRIATNKCLDRLKKARQQVNWTDLAGSGQGGAVNPVGLEPVQSQPQQLEELIQRETKAEMDRVLDLLRRHLKRANSKYLEICKLRLKGELTDEQIAAEVGCSRATVQRAWAYARDFLKSRLDEANAEDTP